MVPGPCVIANVVVDSFHLPLLLSLPLHRCCPCSMGLELAQEVQKRHSSFLIHLGFTGQSPEPPQGLVRRPYKRLTNPPRQPKRKQVTHEIRRNTARSTTVRRQNCYLFVIHLSELLSRRSLEGVQALPAWSGFGVREGGKSSSLYHRESFFLSFPFFFAFTSCYLIAWLYLRSRLLSHVHRWHDGRQFPTWGKYLQVIPGKNGAPSAAPSAVPTAGFQPTGQVFQWDKDGCNELRDAVVRQASPQLSTSTRARSGRALLCLEYLCVETRASSNGFKCLPDISVTRTLLQDRICT